MFAVGGKPVLVVFSSHQNHTQPSIWSAAVGNLMIQSPEQIDLGRPMAAVETKALQFQWPVPEAVAGDNNHSSCFSVSLYKEFCKSISVLLAELVGADRYS